MLLIANEWRDTGKRLVVRNPADGNEIGSVAIAGQEEVKAAVEAAKEALGRPLSSFKRSSLLRVLGERLKASGEEMARLIAEETGKVIRECHQEVERALVTLQFSAEEALRIEGEVLPCDVTEQELGKYAMALRVPLGVVAAITPFNFPLNVPMHKVAPALAGGNALVLKPSPHAPLTANRLGEMVIEAGWPPGWFNIVHGDGQVAEMVAASGVQAINLTGGTVAGRALSKHAFGSRLLLELGGNDPIIIASDADLDLAVPIVVAHRFGSSGQRCTSCKRLFVEESLFEDVLHRLRPMVESLVVGDPMDESADMGPLISLEAAVRVEERVNAFRAAGAVVHIGGRREGPYYWPTLITGLDPTHPEALQETFGPVLPIYSYPSLDKVIEWINASPYGLQAGIFTNCLETVRELFRRLEVGTLVVNHGPNLRIESLPFGGVKESGSGREGVRFAIHEMTTLKTLVF